MEEIVFKDTLGRTVKIGSVSGANGSWDVYVDNYFFAQIFKRNGNWVAEAPNPKDLQADDLQIFADLVAEYHKCK